MDTTDSKITFDEKGVCVTIAMIFIKICSLTLSVYKLKGYLVVHLVASHPFVRLYYSILCKILRKKLIITYTDNIGSFSNLFSNLMNKISIRLATVPTVLNIEVSVLDKKLT